jgi:hypothetical protein
MDEPEGALTDEGAVLARGVVSDGRERPSALTTSASAAAENRLRSMAARYTVTMTYAKTTLTLLTGLSRFDRLRTLLDPGRDLV